MDARGMVVDAIMRMVNDHCLGERCDTCKLWVQQAKSMIRRKGKRPDFRNGQTLNAESLQRALYWAATL